MVLQSVTYDTKEPFLTMLGSEKIDQSAIQLYDYTVAQGISSKLNLVPEETAVELSKIGFLIEEDRDSFEYIYSTQKLSLSEGSQYKQKRKQARLFEQVFHKVRFEIRDMHNPNLHGPIMEALEGWAERKRNANKPLELDAETQAIKRFLQQENNENVLLTCLFDKERMIAFSIDEILSNKYAIGHFIKANTAYRGIYEYLNEKTAAVLLERGAEYWNWQQDLGIEGLRQLKKSYHPIQLLKKYFVYLDGKHSLNH